ncbi:winged helix DNA-binding domain-containing protein [Aeromicrobium piscarium]|uniref:Winged helix DNA-binding domain-containing protein n=1 Tax=Aeromicrobium piscarium TaxID=2590901 RepID=A0A554SPY2_9ACTN|nr:winged helix DNA-binding domain-containing protein [Aeromicrobium piscarium]TSD68319.1 winged helix DNA-binding domain-containing protein [Aeromicrobium piscarium]
MTVTIDDAERRRRLGVRHALATPADSSEEVAQRVVALHSTDPASMTIGVCERLIEPSIADLERALYSDRTLVRVLAMRRTVFAVPADLAGSCLAATSRSVAAPERRKLLTMLRDSAIEDPERFLDHAHAAARGALPALGVFRSADLAAADPILTTRVEIGAGTRYATTQSMASRLLTLMSAEGHVVRAKPAGTWASTQFTWCAAETWTPALTERPTPEDAAREIARRWLAAYGPAPLEDLCWWTGWTKTTARAALAAIDTTEVRTESGPAIALSDDLAATPEPPSWVALLPALDSTTMGWKQRSWYLGDHAAQLFDNVGNAGPTIWADGRIVGGWTIRDDATVALRLLEDIGTESQAAIDDRAHRIERLLDGTVIKARARRWTTLEKELRA